MVSGFSVCRSGCELVAVSYNPRASDGQGNSTLHFHDLVTKKKLSSWQMSTLLASDNSGTLDSSSMISQCIDVSDTCGLMVVGGIIISKRQDSPGEQVSIVCALKFDHKGPLLGGRPKVFEQFQGGVTHVKFLEDSDDGLPRYVATDREGWVAIVNFSDAVHKVEYTAKVHSDMVTSIMVNGSDIFTSSLDKTITKTKVKPSAMRRGPVNN